MKLNAQNVALVLSMLVEAKEKIHTLPKGVITLLGDTILDTLIEKNKTVEVTSVLWKNLEKGEILMASPHESIQKAIDDLQLFDTWQDKETDFLYPIFTSISKNKSDRIMTREITINQRDACKRDITLNQRHGWNVATESQIKKMAYDLDINDRLPLLLPIQ